MGLIGEKQPYPPKDNKRSFIEFRLNGNFLL